MSEQSKTPLQEIIGCQRSINVFEFPSDGSTDLTNEADTNPFIDTNLNSRISKSHVTLLSRQYHYVLPCTLLMYILLQYIIGSRSNICSTYREPAAESTNIAYYCAGACFFMSGLQQLVRILSYRNQSVGCMSRSIFLAALTVSLIAGSSSYLTGNSPIKQRKFFSLIYLSRDNNHRLTFKQLLFSMEVSAKICLAWSQFAANGLSG